jgi:membrane fusion protein, multidrug efflux system
MRKKIIFIVLGIIFFVGALFSRAFFESGATGDRVIEIEDHAVPVEVIEIKNTDIQLFIELSGRLQAEEKIDLFAEVSGVLLRTNPPFRVGNVFQKGQILINIDDREHRQEMIAQRSNFLSSVTQLLPDIRLDYSDSYDQWVTYVEEFDPQRRMPELPEPKSAQERHFLTGRNIYSQYHTIRQMEVRSSKFQIRAPFTGSVTEASINPGTLVRSGQSMGQFAKLNSYELIATVRVDDLQHIEIGDLVTLHPGTLTVTYSGEVARISNIVDPATQMVNIFIKTNGENLREGIFLYGEIAASKIHNAAKLPREILLETNEVFVIRDSIAQLKQVELRHIQNDSVIVEGLQENTLVINERRNPNFEGTEVRPIK